MSVSELNHKNKDEMSEQEHEEWDGGGMRQGADNHPLSAKVTSPVFSEQLVFPRFCLQLSSQPAMEFIMTWMQEIPAIGSCQPRS